MLENLYNNGIISYVPYDLCQIPPVSPVGQTEMPSLGNIKQSVLGNSGINNVNNSNYLDTAMKGQMYGYYGNSNDSFVGSNYGQNSSSQQAMQMYGGGYYGGGVNRGVNSGNYAGGMNYAATGNPYSMSGYGAVPNSYSPTNTYGNYSAGTVPDNGVYNRYDRKLQSGSGNEIRDLVDSQINDTKKSVLNSSPILKGLLAAAIIIGTPILIFKGKKSPVTSSSKFNNFLSKLNPKNWFQDKIDWSKCNPKNWFDGNEIDWSKLNPANWTGGKIDWSKLNPKNWSKHKIDWSKLNPKNWFKKKP